MFCILAPQKYKRDNAAMQPNEKAGKIGFFSVPTTKIARFSITKNIFFWFNVFKPWLVWLKIN